MDSAPLSFWKRALVFVLVALAIAAVVGGCTVPSFSSHGETTSTLRSATVETWDPSPDTSPRSSTLTTKRPTSTTAWREASTSTTVRRTTTSATARQTTTSAAGPTTGDAEAIAAEVDASVVLVTAIAESDTTGYLEMDGTGVVYRRSGSYAYIITNNHVIERSDGKASSRIRVKLPSGSTVTAKLIGRDPTCDLALLRVKSNKVEAAVFRTDLSALEEGDFVVAVGKPSQLKRPVVSGEITGFYHDIDYPDGELTGVDTVIEISAPLVKGFSGGPLLDYKGRVIGVNMARYIDEPGGIALPSDFVVDVIERLLDET